MYFKLIDLSNNEEVGRWPHEAQTLRMAEVRGGEPLHWSTDGTTLLTRRGVAAFKVVKVGFRAGPWRDRAETMAEVRGGALAPLVQSIKWLHLGPDEWRRDIYLLEVERQYALRLEGHVGLSPDEWALVLGIKTRHQDCEGLQAFNHAFERGAIAGAIRMLDCEGGRGSPPTTDQFIERERSGEWYPRACR